MNSAHPDYACAILRDDRGQFLLELRPPHSRFAAGRLTCYGGRREPGEDAAACLRRELVEELGWRLPDDQPLDAGVDLWVASQWIARFFSLPLTIPLEHLQPLPGHTPVLLREDELATSPLSPWHAAVLSAWLAGETVVHLRE